MAVGAKRSPRAKAQNLPVLPAAHFRQEEVPPPGPAPMGLSEAFVDAVTKDFIAGGAKAIATMREEKPDLYLKIVLGILPKELADAARSAGELVVIERRIVHDPV